eukprot:COSAG01_NODE_8788_length_2659_cov_1.946484_1_plen_145_part_00
MTEQVPQVDSEARDPRVAVDRLATAMMNQRAPPPIGQTAERSWWWEAMLDVRASHAADGGTDASRGASGKLTIDGLPPPHVIGALLDKVFAEAAAPKHPAVPSADAAATPRLSLVQRLVRELIGLPEVPTARGFLAIWRTFSAP